MTHARRIPDLKMPEPGMLPHSGSIKVAFIIDAIGGGGQSGAEERSAYEQTLRAWLPRVAFTFCAPTLPSAIEENTDILVFDWGGAAAYDTRAADWTRAVVSWASDHPQALIIVPSSYAYERLLKHELEESGLYHLPNLFVTNGLHRWGTPCLPAWWLAGLSQ